MFDEFYIGREDTIDLGFFNYTEVVCGRNSEHSTGMVSVNLCLCICGKLSVKVETSICNSGMAEERMAERIDANLINIYR